RPAVESGEDFTLHLLEREGVLVHPGHFFDLPGEGYLALSLLPPATAFKEGLEALSRALSNR
ncbi:MAG TPA: hypothetical protein VFF77_00375, partial [Holophagaceae bacterium]|nr:hypothetical protein [Holophagaceae bacterium]